MSTEALGDKGREKYMKELGVQIDNGKYAGLKPNKCDTLSAEAIAISRANSNMSDKRDNV